MVMVEGVRNTVLTTASVLLLILISEPPISNTAVAVFSIDVPGGVTANTVIGIISNNNSIAFQ